MVCGGGASAPDPARSSRGSSPVRRSSPGGYSPASGSPPFSISAGAAAARRSRASMSAKVTGLCRSRARASWRRRGSWTPFMPEMEQRAPSHHRARRAGRPPSLHAACLPRGIFLFASFVESACMSAARPGSGRGRRTQSERRAAACPRGRAVVPSARTSMRAAVKLEVTIPKDRLVQLPEDVPEGRAEIIVLYPGPEAEGEGAPKRVKRAERGRAERPLAPPGPAPTERVNYFERLTARQPVPLSAKASRARWPTSRATSPHVV